MKHLIVFIVLTALLTLMCSMAVAQTESRRITKQLSPILNENVAAVVHVDLAKVDLDKLDAALRSILADQAVLQDSLEVVRKNFEKQFQEFKTRNIRDVYFLSIPALFDRLPFLMAFPLPESMNESERQKLAEEAKSMNGQCVFRGFMLLFENDKYREDVLKLLSPPTPPTSELFEALQSVEGTAAQMVVMLPDYVRRVLREMPDPLPTPFSALPIPVLLDGVRWAAVGFDAENVRLDLVVKSQHEHAAQYLHAGLEKVVDHWLTDPKKNIALRQLIDTLQANNIDSGTFFKALLPRPNADRLVLSIDKTFLKEKSNVVPNFVEMVASLFLQGQYRQVCVHNLKEIALALHNHHDVYQKLPPLCTVGQDGKPLHSWRVHLLPFVGSWALHKKIRLEEPWDSEYNRQFHKQCPAIFQCPAAAAQNPKIRTEGLTTYSVIVGKNAWPDGNKRYEMSMITDGTSNTWAVLERKTPVCWMDPTQEIMQEEAEKGINRSVKGIGAPHPSTERYGTTVAWFDGSVHFYTENLTLPTVRGFVSRNGGETFSEQYDDAP